MVTHRRPSAILGPQFSPVQLIKLRFPSGRCALALAPSGRYQNPLMFTQSRYSLRRLSAACSYLQDQTISSPLSRCFALRAAWPYSPIGDGRCSFLGLPQGLDQDCPPLGAVGMFPEFTKLSVAAFAATGPFWLTHVIPGNSTRATVVSFFVFASAR